MLGNHNSSLIFDSIFESLPSVINPHDLKPISSLYLPFPTQIVTKETPKLPNIFLSNDEVKGKKNTACPHTLRKHYAKNMCYNCYHRKGREKAPWNCLHDKMAMYAKGKCLDCYLKDYKILKKQSDHSEKKI